jgi:hypothetical protein
VILRVRSGCAIAQAVSCCLPTTVVRVRSCAICGGQSSTGASFSQVLRFPLPIIPHWLLHTHHPSSYGPVVASVIMDSVPLHPGGGGVKFRQCNRMLQFNIRLTVFFKLEISKFKITAVKGEHFDLSATLTSHTKMSPEVFCYTRNGH